MSKKIRNTIFSAMIARHPRRQIMKDRRLKRQKQKERRLAEID